MVLPSDLVVTDNLEGTPGRIEVVAANAVPPGLMAVDIGPATREEIANLLAEAGTVFWNGPMGVFEKPPFDAGTVAVAEALGVCPGFTVIGGGETVAAARRAEASDRIDHVSTGGGRCICFERTPRRFAPRSRRRPLRAPRWCCSPPFRSSRR